MGYELTHDNIAKQIFQKASTEAQTRRKVERYIEERYQAYLDREARLTKDDLDYITPYLSQVNISKEEARFLEAERKALRQAEVRRRILIAGVVLVLSVFSIVSFVLWQRANLQTEIAKEAKEEAQQKQKEAEENLRQRIELETENILRDAQILEDAGQFTLARKEIEKGLGIDSTNLQLQNKLDSLKLK